MSSTNYILSRLKIINHKLTSYEKVPLCVLKEIADTTGIIYQEDKLISQKYVKELFHSISKNEIYHSVSLTGPWTSSELRYIARFINPNIHVKWSVESLTKAFKFLITFQFQDVNFAIGSQTSIHPHNVNYCLLYRYCLDNNISCSLATEPIMLERMVKLSLSSSTTILTMAQNIVRRMDNQQLISMIISSNVDPFLCNHHNDHDTFSHDSILSVCNKFASNEELRKAIIPVTSSEAIWLAATIYRIDITKAIIPIEEYKNIQSSQGKEYVPSDSIMLNLYALNKNLIDLNKTWNPIIPDKCYGSDLLSHLVQEEGHIVNGTDSLFNNQREKLELSFIDDTWYYGKYPNIINKETPFTYDIVEEIKSDSILCYGSRSESMTAFTVEEIYQLFKNNMNFVNPFNKPHCYSNLSMEKLKRICYNNQSREIYYNLLCIIKSIEFNMNETNDRIKRLHSYYNSSNISQRKLIEDCFMKLFYLTMYMRAWNGRSKIYPIERSIILDQDNIDRLVTISINDFEDSANKLSLHDESNDNIILSLPLIKWNADTKEYISSTSIDEGLTIGDRLKIVRNEENNKVNPNSCIRLSSNWFASSVHRYMSILGMKELFDITKLKIIS